MILKLLHIIIFFLLLSSFAIAQGLFNRGALIVIQSGALVKIDGDANGNFVNSTNTTDGRIDLDGIIQLDGNWTNNATLGGHVFINIGTNGLVEMIGTTQQWIGGNTFTDFESLTLNNAAGAQMMVNLNRVNGTLYLQTGAMLLNNFTLIQNNSSSGSVTRTNGYLVSETENSKFQWNIGANTGIYTFPFGVTAAYIPFIANISMASGTSITASTWHTATNNTPYPTGVTNMNDPSGDISVPHVADRFWLPLYSGYTAMFRFTYDDFSVTDDVGSLNELNLLAQYWNGTEWILPLEGVNDFANDNVNSINSRSGPWVLVDKDVPLPVSLLSFEVFCNNDNVLATWVTASETNNDYFTLEKSSDASNWVTVALIDGSGNSNAQLHYEYSDVKPFSGLSYYRLKQTDFDGKYVVYSPVSVVCSTNDHSAVQVYPNPCSSQIVVQLNNLAGEKTEIKIHDMLGQIVFLKQIENNSSEKIQVLDASNWADGIYDVWVINGNFEYHCRVVKKQ